MAITYSQMLEHALRTAIARHESQQRKTGDVPYISHLFHVAIIINSHGFPEHVVCAALLHDTIEDTDYTPEELLDEFGESICSIVLDLTENKHLKWAQRKQAYLEVVRHASPHVKAVCCADKIHNLSTILSGYREKGEDIWRVFSKGRDVTLQFYRDALVAVSTGWNHAIIEEYRRIIQEADRMFGVRIDGEGSTDSP